MIPMIVYSKEWVRDWWVCVGCIVSLCLSFLSALAWQFEWIGGVLKAKAKAKAKCCLTEDQEKLDKQAGLDCMVQMWV